MRFQHRRLLIVAWTTLAASFPAVAQEFPRKLVDFVPYKKNPVFIARGPGHWDARIRERGWILREGGTYHMWYTGYADQGKDQTRLLGYATSTDGLQWTRHRHNPLLRGHWVEDMCVVKHGDTYYMFAEGLHDIAQLLTSTDRVHWTRVGSLDIRRRDGSPVPGPYGTPTVWMEDDTWYLFYERKDEGVWLAISKDLRVWKNVKDDPVLARGPREYDKYAVALNQIVKYRGRYFGYYHASDSPDWREWTTNVATSTDLIHWQKYPGNPILRENKSSGIVVSDGRQLRLVTMHGQVHVHLPRQGN